MREVHNNLTKSQLDQLEPTIKCPQCGFENERDCQILQCLRCNKILDNDLLINKQCQGNCRKCRNNH